MRLRRYAKGDPPPEWAQDVFAHPRDPITAIHGATEGAWSYRTIAPGEYIPPDWHEVQRCGNRVLIKYTHWERTIP
jgi:hypothetical protein